MSLSVSCSTEPSPVLPSSAAPTSATTDEGGPTTEHSACTGTPMFFRYRSRSSRGPNGFSSSGLVGLVVADILALTSESQSGGQAGHDWTGLIRGPLVERAVAEIARSNSDVQ